MTDTNQKLREALQVAEAALSDIGDADREPGDDLAWCERRAAQSLPLIRQALALPTADHIPDAGEMVADHLPDAGKMIETAAPGGGYVRPVVLDARQSLPTAAQVDDINVAESFTSAAPVGEREAFEAWILDAPGYFGASVKRDQEGQYKCDITESAWDAWQARASLSAGDAVDAQRYRWLADCNNYEAGLALIIDPKLTEQALGAAIDAAILVRGEVDPLTLYRVWPDGTVQEGAESPYAWMSDDFEYVDATDEEQAALSAGDAVDGPLIDEGSKPALSPLSDKAAIALIEEHTNDENVIHAHEAIDLIRSVERAHGIDASMRKGQL